MLILGKEVAAKTLEKITENTIEFEKKYSRKPTLAVIIVGDDPASQTYVKNKINGCKQVGFNSLSYEYENGTPEDEIVAKIKVTDFLINLCYDKQIINSKRYVKFGEKLDDILKYSLGWKKTILNKNGA